MITVKVSGPDPDQNQNQSQNQNQNEEEPRCGLPEKEKSLPENVLTAA
jgi:hypothetical protein